VLTAAHVVENNSTVSVTFYSYTNNKSAVADVLSASVVMTDTTKDLALIKVDSGTHLLRSCGRLAPRNYSPFLFTPIYTVGCSLGLAPRPSEGIITVITENHWEVSSPILPGNSGGPVFDAKTHAVIGIAVWVKTYYGQLITTMAGIVPICEIYRFLDGVQEFNSSRVNESKDELVDFFTRELICQLIRYSEVSSELRISGGARPAGRMDDRIKRANPSSAKQQPVLRKDTKMLVSAVDLWIPDSVAPDPTMGDKWESVLKTLAVLINQRRKEKIPDEAAYQNKLAGLANQAWGKFIGALSPTFRSKHGRLTTDIKNFHDKNMQSAFDHWSKKLDQIFATVDGVEAKRFKDQITAAKEFWTNIVGSKMLRLTGDKIRGEGAATIATYWLIGEPSAAGMLRPQDTHVVGGPYQTCLDEMVQSFQAALMSRLIQAGMQIISSDFDGSVIAAQNATINHLVQSLVNPGLGITPFATGGLSHVDFVKDGALLKLSIQVDQI
jgi:hypothetical protein